MSTTPSHYPVMFMGIDRPSQAVRAMVKGLKDASQRKTFTIDMGTYGKYIPAHDMCCGCAATCALMELTHDPRLVKTLFTTVNGSVTPGYALEQQHPKSDKFESVMEDLRSGHVRLLFHFFELSGFVIEPSNLPKLTTGTWQQDLHYYEDLATEWEARGL